MRLKETGKPASDGMRTLWKDQKNGISWDLPKDYSNCSPKVTVVRKGGVVPREAARPGRIAVVVRCDGLEQTVARDTLS